MSRISDANFLNVYENIFKIIDKNRSYLHFPKFAQYVDISESYNQSTKQITNDFLKIGDKRLLDKIGIYKVRINDDEKILEITPIQKIGIREKEIQRLMKKNFNVYDGFNTVEGEYFILLEL